MPLRIERETLFVRVIGARFYSPYISAGILILNELYSKYSLHYDIVYNFSDTSVRLNNWFLIDK